MSEYITTFSNKVAPILSSGITQLVVETPPGPGWILQSQHFVEETSQMSWVWKKDESNLVAIDNTALGLETFSIDTGSVDEVDKNKNEEPLISVRIKPGSGGEIFAKSFSVLCSNGKDVVARLYICDHVSGGSWVDHGTYSQVNVNPGSTVPSTRKQVGTIFLDKYTRSLKSDIDAIMIAVESDSLLVTCESLSNSDIDVAAFITWGEKNV